MAVGNYSNFPENNFGNGIDQQSPEDRIQEGYVESLKNADPTPTGSIKRRVGYQGYAGQVPVRVKSYTQDGTSVRLTLDENIKLPTSATNPIIVYGKGSTGTGEFASQGSHYYSTSSSDIRKVMDTGSDTLTISAAEHGYSAQDLFVEVFESTSDDNLSNQRIDVDSITIDASYNITVGYTNTSGEAKDVYISVYRDDNQYTTEGQGVSTGPSTISISAITHNLSDKSIVAVVFSEEAGEFKRIDYDQLTIQANNDVDISFVNTSGSDIDVRIALFSTPLANFTTGAVASGETRTIQIPLTATDATPFVVLRCYLENGDLLEEVLPSEVKHTNNLGDNQLEVTFANNGPDGVGFEIYWEFVEIATNVLEVTGTTSFTGSDSVPQLVVYGLCHHELYEGSTASAPGHVNHIDSYRSAGEDRMVCGLGGNLYSARFSSETDLSFGSSSPKLTSRLGSDVIISPAFHDTGETPGRTRGFITGDNLFNNLAEITTVSHVSEGLVDYTLSIPNMVISGTLSTILAVGDELTVSQCGRALHNGTFDIVSVTNTATDTLVVRVNNSLSITSRYDEIDVGGLAGVFTDDVTLESTTNFLADDVLTSELFLDSDAYNVVSSSGTVAKLRGVTLTASLPVGLRLYASRTTSELPLESVSDIVVGDTLTYTGLSRYLQVTSIDTATSTVTIDEEISVANSYNGNETVSVVERWVPIEIPSDSFDATPSTKVTHFDSNNYVSQPSLRSVMVNDSLFLTDGSNEVMKFDGVSLYRAGLPRWEPGVFITKDESANSKIDITGSSTFNYYFRFNAIDINGNQLSGAAIGSSDFSITLDNDAEVQIKLVGMPSFDSYDFDSIDIQVYRTKANTTAGFFFVQSKRISFNSAEPYILIRDNISDDEFAENQTDAIQSTLLGGNVLGNTWTQPPKAKYCTTVDNRLVLGNFSEYQKLDIQLFRNSSASHFSTFSNASNRDWVFRKDNTNTSTTPDMSNVAHYQFVNSSSAVTFDSFDASGFTVDLPGHTSSVGDWVYLFHSSVGDYSGDPPNLDFSGWYQVVSEIADKLTFNFTNANTLSSSNFPDQIALSSASGIVPVFLGTDFNYDNLRGSRDSSFVVGRRLADAINCSMRATTVPNFVPWMSASAGNSYNSGQVVIENPSNSDTFMEVEAPDYNSDVSVFVNGFELAAEGQASALINNYPSRIAMSYVKYPEMFDNLNAVNPNESDSVIDVNPADGQEITAIIPFFGKSAFGAAQSSQVVVVFKTNSIYVVDLSAKAQGQNPVQRLHTEGLGCEAPYSVAVTRGGIIFANLSGIYRLNNSLQVDYVGWKYERIFKDEITRANIGKLQGHHDPIENTYKVSYPLSSESNNSQVAVYNHTRESQSNNNVGSWTTYTNHASTGWANGSLRRFFGSTVGRVFSIRQAGNETDYRDDSSAIDTQITLRALDLGDSSIRKVFRSFLAKFKNSSKTSTVTAETSTQLNSVFQSAGSSTISDESNSQDGLSDDGSKKVELARFAIPTNSGTHLQIRLNSSNIDEPMELTGVSIRARARSANKIKEAK